MDSFERFSTIDEPDLNDPALKRRGRRPTPISPARDARLIEFGLAEHER
jgi:hypothetical protein